MDKIFYICFICLFSAIVVHSDSEMGPADLMILRVEDCEDADKYPQPMGIEMNKVNRSHSGISACLDLGRMMDKFVQFNISVAKWGDGGWKPNQINYYADDACETLVKYVPEPWNFFLTTAGAMTVTCPLPKGKYCVDKMIVDMAGTFPSMIYGDLRVDTDVYVNGQLYKCARMYLKSDPQKSR